MGGGDEPDVNYGLEIVGEKIPGRDGTGSSGSKTRYSPLRDQVELLMKDEKYHNTWVKIADYGSGNVASGAMRDMKHYYGESPEIGGLTFTTHRYSVTDSETNEPMRDENGKLVRRCKLLVKYEPAKVNPEKRLEWERNKIILMGRDAAKKLGIDVDAISPSRQGG